METGKTKSALEILVSWRPRNTDGTDKVQSCQLESSLPFRGRVSLSVLFKPSTNWMWPIHIEEGNLPYLESTHLHVNFICKHPHKNTQNYVWPIIWVPCGPIKKTHKINHYSDRVRHATDVQQMIASLFFAFSWEWYNPHCFWISLETICCVSLCRFWIHSLSQEQNPMTGERLLYFQLSKA